MIVTAVEEPETAEMAPGVGRHDWENVETRLQHMVEDKELKEAFAGLYLDVE